jgi:putative tryptophan/tyrosine transport system substrate-binding protein
MNRRAFVTGLGAVLTTPLAAEAQQPATVARIGFLSLNRAPSRHLHEAFRQGLRDLGYLEGRNIIIEYRDAEGKPERLAALAAELVALKMDVIVAPGTLAAVAAKRATSIVSIVFPTTGDPIADGLVETLARPGGNVTGIANLSVGEMIGKALQMLKQALPGISRVAALSQSGGTVERTAGEMVTQTKAAARALGVGVEFADVRRADELENAFRDMTRRRAQAVLVLPPALRRLRRSHTQRRPARGPARRAVDEIRAADQRQDCQGARAHDSPVGAAAGGPGHRVNRRAFVAGLGAVLAALLAAEAQTAGKVTRIGILGNVPRTDPQGAELWGAFIDGLRELGYVDGQNMTIEQRSSEGRYERLPALARELVRLKVDVIVVPAGQNARAAQQVTRTIPIVAASLADPVASGLVASFARPGGNVTGLSFAAPELAGKQIELLKDMLPGATLMAVLANPTNSSHSAWLREANAASRSLRLNLQTVEARTADELDNAFAALTSQHASALLVLADAMFLLHRTRIADLAAKRRVPAMYGLKEHVDAGGLVFYGASLRDSFRRAATYVDKIIKGAHPGDLPIEQPSKFELVLNMKAAKALGLTIPPSLLLRADQVIE